uniref:Uncharacterized protein n=1 Tax=Meloidogyne enterolobii TaxID=390850 RepID=A0A6V7U1B8_MELEN|nr:unnamed protein product [Meloidogyne enterolobii]
MGKRKVRVRLTLFIPLNTSLARLFNRLYNGFGMTVHIGEEGGNQGTLGISLPRLILSLYSLTLSLSFPLSLTLSPSLFLPPSISLSLREQPNITIR